MEERRIMLGDTPPLTSVLPDGYVAMFHFDGNVDDGGGSIDTSMVNPLLFKYTDGKYGKSLCGPFSNARFDIKEGSPMSNMKYYKNLSVDFWFKIKQPVDNTIPKILRISDKDGFGSTVYIYLNGTSEKSIVFSLFNTSASASIDVTDDEWHHYAFQYTENDNMFSWFLDGGKQGERSVSKYTERESNIFSMTFETWTCIDELRITNLVLFTNDFSNVPSYPSE